MRYDQMRHAALISEYNDCMNELRAYQALGLSINMSRGKPNGEQLALSHGLLDCLAPEDCFSENGTDCRNYGGLDGLPEMKRLFAAMLDTSPDEVMVGGNSSLNMMFDCIATLMLKSSPGWRGDGTVSFICPAPGYDRHFAICEYFGINMHPVAMTPTGPDMDAVEELAANNPSVAGMWCVPVFSNPQGYVYSDETILRLAAMPTAHRDFRIFWDNAYAVHHFRGERPRPLNLLRACEEHGCPDRPILFTSFSKITFAGAAVACMAASENNRAFFRNRLSIQTVGPDKINQLRHVRYFKNIDGVLTHMRRLADLLRPKFDMADAVLSERLAGTGAAEWHNPSGGYFLSVDTMPGCAKRAVNLCKDAGVELTEVGATFPYKNDPLDRNIRVAPSYLTTDELKAALDVFCVAVRIAALEKILSTRGDS